MTTNESKIVSRRELAVRLCNGSVDAALVSKRLERVIQLWIGRKEIVMCNGLLKMA